MIYVLLVILMVMVCYLIVSVKEAKECAERIEYKMKNLQNLGQSTHPVAQIVPQPVGQRKLEPIQIVPQSVAQLLPEQLATPARRRAPLSADVKKKISESLRRKKEERVASKPSVQQVQQPPQASS